MENEKIEHVLFDGTEEEIASLKCTCSGKIHYTFSIEVNSMKYWCDDCGKLCLMYKCHYIPNCVKFFGESM